MANLSTLNNGASIAADVTRVPPLQVTQADVYPIRGQVNSEIESKHSNYASLRFPMDTGKYHMSLGISSYNRTNLFSVALNILGSIKLPLPMQMVDSLSVNYEQQELGSIPGAAVNAAMGKINGQGGSLSNIFQAEGLIATAAVNTLSGIFGQTVDTTYRAATGLAPNQYMTILLKGPQYKKHEFSWKLSPRNEQESESVRKIIATLQDAASPGLKNAFQFSFPKIFDIGFNPNPQMLYRFLPAVLENVSVNYAPSGVPSFYRRTEGPDTVELRLSFLELELWLSDRGMFNI